MECLAVGGVRGERQAGPARADEHEACEGIVRGVADLVAHLDLPELVRGALDAEHLVVERELGAVRDEIVDSRPGRVGVA